MLSGKFDVIVIGGGPAGLSSASITAGSGFSTMVVESGAEIGIPLQCGEVISDTALDLSGMGKGEWITHTISGSRITTWSGKSVLFSGSGYCIDRRLFEKELARNARSLGAGISLSTRVKDAAGSKDGWTVRTEKGDMDCRAVILAAGPASYLNRIFNLSSNREYMKALEVKIRRRDTSPYLDFFVKASMKGGYGWYFPRGEEVNAGVVVRDDPVSLFKWLREKFSIEDREIISWHAGIIPDGGPVERFVGDRVVSVGDSGGFSHPVSKGGIHSAMLSGRKGAAAVVSLLSGNNEALKDLDKEIRSHPAFSGRNLIRRDLLASLDDRALDELAPLLKGVRKDRKWKKQLLKAIIPHLYPHLLKILLTNPGILNDGWLTYTF